MGTLKNTAALVISLSFLLSPTQAWGDDMSKIKPMRMPPDTIDHSNELKLEVRFRRQHARINRGLSDGTINETQAADLKRKVDEIFASFNQQMKENNGTLKPEQSAQIEAALNQTNQLIHTYESAGLSVRQGKNVLGPGWSPGKDGAQKPNTLLKQMKREEKRELRQEKQANLQKIEQEQLDYERGMIPSLGDQRKDIIKQKDDLDDIRKEQGAN